MYTNVKTLAHSVQQNKQESKKNVKAHQNTFMENVRLAIVCLLFLALMVSLFISYRVESHFFWPLLGASIVIALVTFISIISNNTKFQKF